MIRYLLLFVIILTCPNECHSLSRRKIIKTLLRTPDQELDVLFCDQEWEKQFDYATILKVDSLYVMYYRAINSLNKPSTAYCYATSNDGIHWVKPKLNVFSFAESQQNNIISDRMDGVSVEYAHGYFWMLADRFYDEQNKVVRGLILYRSKDGIHFEKDERLRVPFFCDSQNEIMWDETSKTFKLYLRSWYKSYVPSIEYHHSHHLYRSVSLLETPSLDYQLNYGSKPLFLAGRDEPPSVNNELPVVLKNNSSSSDFDIYCAYVHKYRANLYIAYPINYYHTDDKKRGGKADNDGYGTIGFWVGKNGRVFKEVKRDYITNGEKWMESCVGHIETDSTFIHYYIPFNNTHSGRPVKNVIRARIHFK